MTNRTVAADVPVGAAFTHEGRELVATKGGKGRIDCSRCVFAQSFCGEMACTMASRNDSISVYFMPIEKYLLMRVKGQA